MDTTIGINRYVLFAHAYCVGTKTEDRQAARYEYPWTPAKRGNGVVQHGINRAGLTQHGDNAAGDKD